MLTAVSTMPARIPSSFVSAVSLSFLIAASAAATGLYRDSLVASDRLDNNIPLDSRDQFVARAGVEYSIGDHWSLRAGYSYGRNPAHARTLTPLTAGIGFKMEHVSVDLTYQYQIPNTVDIHESGLAAGDIRTAASAWALT